jgi:ubiquinone biosynthesis protein COQ9
LEKNNDIVSSIAFMIIEESEHYDLCYSKVERRCRGLGGMINLVKPLYKNESE